MSNKKIALLAGGISNEREPSLLSSTLIEPCLISLGYSVVKIDPDHTLPEKLLSEKPDIVFNCLHGKYGEDGCIQGLLEVMKIPYTHSGVLASSLGMDKEKTKIILKEHGVPTPKYKIFNKKEVIESIEHSKPLFEYPYVVKPISDGSSVGVSIIKSAKDMIDLTHLKESVMVEEYIAGIELSCAYFNNKAVGIIELETEADFWDYSSKYTSIGKHICPARIPHNVTDEILKYTEIAHNVLGCKTISRSDFRYNPSQGVFFLEINTHPGMTPTSSVPDIARAFGYSVSDIVKQLIAEAKCDS